MKSIDINTSTYNDIEVKSNDKNLKFKVNDCVRIWKYKNIFAKGYTQNWSEEVFVNKKFKIVNCGHM